MSSGWRLFPWIAACACGCGPPALAGGPAAAAPIAVAHSAQLTIEAVEAGDSLAIRIRHAADHTPVNSKDVIVSVDGRSVPVTLADGAYVVSAKELRGRGARVLEIVVAHDGIREILTGKIALPEASATASLLRDHKQIVWWILNVAIVLIAAIALSRRKS
ncbi:MAG: hypothetical protein E6K52_01255 [Gammaproteobacteria bacterium]|nr:MAG: hypothetical protein E6K52_01255 [Gammaproteobacteria bacterium]